MTINRKESTQTEFMTEVILASHGLLSKGLLDTLSMIIGNPGEHVRAYSLQPGENPRDFLNELEAEIENSQDRYIILADIQGGSVHTALSELVHYPQVVLLSGMNLPMALEVVTRCKDGLDESDYTSLVDSSRLGINLLHHTLAVSADEEF